MGQYKYKALDSSGKSRTGVISGANKDLAKSHLARMRLRVIRLDEIGEDGTVAGGMSLLGGRIKIDSKGNVNFSGGKTGKVSDKEIIIFTKQLATMISSGVPLNQSLQILAKQQSRVGFGEIVNSVQRGIEEGQKFSDSLARYPLTFDVLYVSMVRAGEESGRLADILVKLVVYIEKAAKIKKQILSAMMYPAVIIGVAFLVVGGLLIFVIPEFASQFRSAGKPLPGLTQAVIDLSDFLVAKWYLILGSMVASGYGLHLWSKTVSGKNVIHKFALTAPIIGDLVRKIAVGRFCSTMSSMLSAGVNIIQALSICASSAGNVIIEKLVLYARSRVEQGQLLSQPISESPIFPLMVVSMIEVGERAGKLDEMLIKVSDFYVEEVDLAVKNMLALIEPILIVFIGIIVGILVIAMYLPIMDLGSVVGG